MADGTTINKTWIKCKRSKDRFNFQDSSGPRENPSISAPPARNKNPEECIHYSKDKYYKQGTKSIHIWHLPLDIEHLSLDIEHPAGIVSPF